MKNRRSKKDEYFTILKKLTQNHFLTRKDFEQPKIKVKAHSEELDEKISLESYVPHSSLIERLEELKKMNAVVEIDFGKRSKKLLPIMEYEITLFGMLFLLKLCYGRKFYPEILRNLRFFAYIEVNLPNLYKAFTRKQLLETLAYICHNTTLDVDYNPEESIQKPSRIPGVTAYEALVARNAVKVYHLEILVVRENFSYVLKDRIPVFTKEVEGKPAGFYQFQAEDKINRSISAAFYHEIIHRCSSKRLKYSKYPQEGKILVLELIRREKKLKPVYLEFLEKIKDQYDIEHKQILEIEKLVSRKRSLLLRKN